MCEGFNSAIGNTRSKSIINMLEDIKVYIMKRWACNRTKLKSRQGSIYPKVQNWLDKESWLTRYWIPRSVLISGTHYDLSYLVWCFNDFKLSQFGPYLYVTFSYSKSGGQRKVI